MKIKSERDKRNYIIIALCAILVVMGVGYAAFSSLLTINGTANITNSWCVGFDSTKTNTYQITKGVATGTNPSGTMTYSGTACETNYKPVVTLASTFHQPGDQIVYTLTIKNKSSVTAAIKSITVDGDSVTSNETKTKGNITYIVNMPEDTTLDTNEETTMTVTVKFQNETDITGPYTGETQTITVGINTEEDDGNGGFIVTQPTFTGTIYRWSTTNLANKDSSSNYPKTIANLTKGTDYITETDYPTYSARATALGKQYYLKHDIVNDEIINSYVCFVSDEEHCMKGGDSGASFATNTQIIQDYQTYYASQNPSCTFSSSGSYCIGGGFIQVSSYSSGGVGVIGSSYKSCVVFSEGSSACS